MNRHFLGDPDDPNDADCQVDDIPAQPRAFAPPQAGAGGQRDQSAVTGHCCI